MNWDIPLFKSYWEEDDIESVVSVIRRGTYWAIGPEIEELERKIANYVGTKYGLTFNSGTSALHADLIAHNISYGEVIVPSFSFISTANSVVLASAKPVFAEIEENNFGLDINDVLEKINNKTKAIIAVHYSGMPCKEIKALQDIASDHKLFLIEDAAESLGSKIHHKKVGAFGNSSMFSFCQNKIITAGEGGIILTNEKKLFEKLKLLRSHGRLEKKADYFSSSQDMDYIEVGYNYRMSSLSAAILLSQFNKIDKIINMRREKAEYYNKRLSDIEGIKITLEKKDQFFVYQMYTIQLEDNKIRDKLQNHLTKSGIMTKIYFEPIHLKTFYKKNYSYKEGDLPITENISKKVLTLPLYPSIKKSEIDYIVTEIKNFLG